LLNGIFDVAKRKYYPFSKNIDVSDLGYVAKLIIEKKQIEIPVSEIFRNHKAKYLDQLSLDIKDSISEIFRLKPSETEDWEFEVSPLKSASPAFNFDIQLNNVTFNGQRFDAGFVNNALRIRIRNFNR